MTARPRLGPEARIASWVVSLEHSIERGGSASRVSRMRSNRGLLTCAMHALARVANYRRVLGRARAALQLTPASDERDAALEAIDRALDGSDGGWRELAGEWLAAARERRAAHDEERRQRKRERRELARAEARDNGGAWGLQGGHVR